MHVDPAFAASLAGLDVATLTRADDCVCVVDADLVLRAYNPAWVRFALDNDGAALLDRYGLGTSLPEAIPEPLRGFYVRRYRQVLATREVFAHDYDCSSPAVYRRFRQSAYPLARNDGLLITHHLLVDAAAAPGGADVDAYRGEQGIVVQCMHCRKVRQPANPARWDWVPALVAKPDTNTSHSLCPYCLDYQYPDLGD